MPVSKNSVKKVLSNKVESDPTTDVILPSSIVGKLVSQHRAGTTSTTRSAVVRARYEPQVGGVNRYKHFHSPLVPGASVPMTPMSTSMTLTVARNAHNKSGVGNGHVGTGESIDKTSPRRTNKIIATCSTGLPSIVNGCLNGLIRPKSRNGQSTAQSVETWLFRRKSIKETPESPTNPTNATNPTAPIKLAVTAASATITSTKLSNSHLPQISVKPKAEVSPLSVSELAKAGGYTVVKGGSDFTKQPLKNGSTTATDDSNQKKQMPTENGADGVEKSSSKPGGDMEHTIVRNGVILRPITLQNVEPNWTSKSPAETSLNPKSVAVERPKRKIKPKAKTREFGVQTIEEKSEEPIGGISMQGVSRESSDTVITSTVSSSTSSKTVGAASPSRRTPKATQTEHNAFFNMVNNVASEIDEHEIEQRAELLAIIESALDETIDKSSRLRANEVIASTARRQAQIWHDAKEFVSSTLLPCSIELASRTRRSASRRPYRHPLDSILHIN